jgi:large subunit ribosomal protein L30
LGVDSLELVRFLKETQPRRFLRRRLKKMAGRLRITQIRSAIGRVKEQKAMVRALGIKRLHQSVEHQDNPAVRGMIQKVKHLVKVEEV